jgi:glycosyltransferase involved in cell wall biosynthesis
MTLELSVVVPVFNEELGIKEFAQELRNHLDALKIDYEVIFINDGSKDSTQQIIDQITWPQLKSYEFRFNAGHMSALEAGLNKSQGEKIITMDSDLQHPPSYIKEFLKIQKETSADVVYGIRNSRKEDNFFKRFTAAIYYFLMKKLSGINIRANAADYRLIVKEVRDVLISLDEQDKIFRLLIPSLNFKEAEISFVADKRKYGKSKYGIRNMGLLAISSVLSFSTKPLRWAIWIGLWAVLISILWIIFIFVAQISGWVIQGWTSLIAAVVLFAGVQLLILGIVGQYIGQIYVTQQRRPKYIFKNKLED